MSCRLPQHLALPVLASLLLAACGSDTPPPAQPGEDLADTVPGASRLVLADAVEPHVRVFDVGERRVLSTHALDGVARVYADGAGHAWAVQGPQNRVHVVHAGLRVDTHGDHTHYEREAPRLLPFHLTRPRPVHFVAHHGWAAVFHDGDGSVSVLRADGVDVADPAVRVLQTAEPHHGVALVHAGRLLVSVPHPDADKTSPVGVAVHALQGERLEEHLGCPGLHGEASSGVHVAFGCADGVLVLTQQQGGTYAARKVPHPPDAPVGVRVGTVAGHDAAPALVGNWGKAALARVDPAAGTLTPLPLPAEHVQFTFSHDGSHVLVLTRDGRLHRLDPATGALVSGPQVTGGGGDGANHGAADPQLAVDRDALYVSDPGRGQVHRVDPATLQVAESYAVGGAPAKLAVVPADVGAH